MSLGKMVIRSASVSTMKVGANNFEVTNQEGMLHTPNGAVLPVKFGIDKEKGAYPSGEYEVSLDSLHADKYGRLELRPVLVLVPIKASAQQPQRVA